MNKEAILRGDGLIGKIAIAVAVALLVGGSTPWWWNVLFRPYMSELKWETNLYGDDINNIDKAEVNTAGTCSDACLKNPDCKSMTFVEHPSPTPGGICWLKNTVPYSSHRPGMTSAVKHTALW
jgi:hypothetical protein